MEANIRQQVRAIDHIVSQNLKKRRVSLGVSQQEIAVALGVSIQQVQKYENISGGKLYNLAHLLGTPLKRFFREN